MSCDDLNAVRQLIVNDTDLRMFYVTAAGDDTDVEIPDTAAVTMVTGISDTASRDTTVNDDTLQSHHDSSSWRPSGMITFVNCTLYLVPCTL